MVKKLLLILIITLLSTFFPSFSYAQTSPQDIACSATKPCPSQINCSVGCLPVNLTCGADGYCHVPAKGICTYTLGMTNGGCTMSNPYGTAGNFYCTRNASVGNMTCQPSSPDGTACSDNSECQPGYASGGSRTCAATQCRGEGTKITATCCPSGKFWCPSTNSCTGQGDGSCPCATENTPTNTPTPPTKDDNNVEDNATCSTSGVKSLKYSQADCYQTGFASSVNVMCNDGSTKTISAENRCSYTKNLKHSAETYCANHKICPTPTPASTNTPTPNPGLACDPNNDGSITDADFDIWKNEFITKEGKKSACFAPNLNEVDLLDFQAWKDLRFKSN